MLVREYSKSNLLSALLIGLAACSTLGAGAARADSFTFGGFSNTAGLNLVGNAATTNTTDGTVLRIVPSLGSQAGAAYSTAPVTLGTNDTFSTAFSFRFTSPSGADPADGITFVLAANPTGLGSAGNGMGYAGVGSSVAIEFDTYNNGLPGASLGYFPAEPNSSNHVAIDENGVLNNIASANVYGNASCGFTDGTPSQNSYATPGCMSNGDLWTANISYDGALLNVTVSDPAEATSFSAISNYAINIGSFVGSNLAYVGFTGSTGSGSENEDITAWQFANTATLPTPPPSTVPEPASLALLGVLTASFCLTRTRYVHQQG